MTDIVNALLVQDGEILLARRAPHRAAYANCWSFPGGHVEPGEDLDAALAREMEEEIGVRPTSFAKVAEIADPRDADVTYHMYRVAARSGGAPRLMGDEHTGLQWMTFTAAAEADGLALAAYRALLQRLGDDR